MVIIDVPKDNHRMETVCVLVAMALAGLLIIGAGYIPESVEEVVPEWVGFAWGALLVLSSVVTLVGVLWRGDRMMGWQWELTGRPGVAGTCIAYAIAVAAGMGSNWGALLAVVVFGAIGVGSLLRSIKVVRLFRSVRAVILAQQTSRGRDL